MKRIKELSALAYASAAHPNRRVFAIPGGFAIAA